MAATYDGSNVRLYVNGVLAATTPKSGAIATSTNPLQLGGDSIYGQYFSGLRPSRAAAWPHRIG